MSAYMSFSLPEVGALFTDGAGYDRDGVVRSLTCKTTIAETAPFAITSVGNQYLGDMIKAHLTKYVDAHGVDALMDIYLPMFLQTFRDEHMSLLEDIHSATDVHFLAWSPTRQGFHRSFQTFEEAHRPDLPCLVLLDPGTGAGRGMHDKGMQEFATIQRPPMPGEEMLDYMKSFGVAFMDIARKGKNASLQTVGDRHLIGGHVDMTIVDAAGARTERVKVYPDRIGRHIDPDRRRFEPQPFTGMNRKQRRAMEAANGNRRMAG